MAYYCFLCNENHDDSPTKEYFIPQFMGAPKRQWLPICKDRNKQYNSMFDSDVSDTLYWVRFKKTKVFKRSGKALLSNGAIKRCYFSYRQEFVPELRTTFLDIFDKEENTRILPRTPQLLASAVAFWFVTWYDYPGWASYPGGNLCGLREPYQDEDAWVILFSCGSVPVTMQL